MKTTVFALVMALTFLGCSSGRPNAEEAKARFMAKYPGVNVVSIKEEQNEVVARSFVIRYQKPDSAGEKEIHVQFVDNTGSWDPNFPDILP